MPPPSLMSPASPEAKKWKATVQSSVQLSSCSKNDSRRTILGDRDNGGAAAKGGRKSGDIIFLPYPPSQYKQCSLADAEVL